MDKKRVLVIVAHPDDEVLGVGGTLIKMIKNGKWEAKIVILTNGIGWRESDTESIANQKKAAAIAAEKMGCDLVVGDFGDQLLDTYPISKITDYVFEQIKEFEPNIVITHHWGDANVDHSITFNAVNVATRPVRSSQYIEKFITLFVPSSSEWNFDPMKSFQPNLFIDVSETLNAKIDVLQTAYGHEMRKFPHPRSKEGVIYYARFFGARVGLEFAESFNLLWSRGL